MDQRDDRIIIHLRSFIAPNHPLKDFRPGILCPVYIPRRTTLGEFVTHFFSKRAKQIGLTAVNGRVADEQTILSDGDQVDVYELLGGG